MRRSILLLAAVSCLALAGCATHQPTAEDIGKNLNRRVMFTVIESSEPNTGTGFVSETQAKGNVEPLIRKIISLHNLKKISQWSIKALGLEAIVAEIRGDRSVDDVVSDLSKDARVESAQPVVKFDLMGYNDPYFHLQNATVGDADFEKIHKLATGKDINVAIIDTGVDRQHPELAGRIVYARNFVDGDQYEFDNDEHGTSVAGLIASAANNDLGIVGVAPEARLMVFKACWQDAQTRKAQCDSYSITKALVEVLKQHPDVLNLSLAGPPDPLIKRLVAAASREGIIVVAAVDPKRAESFPASMPQVIAVNGPLYVNDTMPRGGVLAPGTDILTTAPGATYAFRSGSSMSTAYVSGVAALMKQRQPMLSGAQLRHELIASSQYQVDRVPVVDICRAVANESGALCPAPAVAANTRVRAGSAPH